MTRQQTVSEDRPQFCGWDPVARQRLNYGGNYCGYFPDQPLFQLAVPACQGKGGIPGVLTTLMARLEGYYYRPRAVLPSLDLANDSPRQQRGERRVACVVVMATLVKFLDLASLRVGVPTPQGFVNLTVPLLARHAGMGLKRTERALRDLKAAGIVTVTQARHRQPDGQWVGLAAVKTVARSLFGVFGLANRLERERKKASKRLKARQAQWEADGASRQTLTGYYRYKLFLEASASKLGSAEKKTRSQRNRKPEPLPGWEHNPQLAHLGLKKMLALQKERPELPQAERYRLTDNWLKDTYPTFY